MCNNKNEKGTVMILVMLITVIIAGLGIAYISTSGAQQKQLTSSIEDQSYQQTALSGFEASCAYLLQSYTTTGCWSTLLAASNAASGTYVSASASANITPTSLSTSLQWCTNIDYYGNTFWAKLENNNDTALGGSALVDADNIVKITVEGWGGGNDPLQRSQTQVAEGLIQYKEDSYIASGALVVGGSLKVYGNASITGAEGDIQANGPVTISGSASVSGDVTSTGTVDNSGTVGGTITPNAPATPIPSIVPSNYKYLATHIFKTDGLVYDQSNNLIATPTDWTYDAATQLWSNGGTDSGVFYFEGSNVKIAGSPGSPATPWLVSIIATGYINMTGSPSISPYSSGGNIACMAGTDLRMRG
ncbi:MAG: polymer-forming cytoskeletal protein, partial [Planctomycetota bacterium]